MKIDAADAAVKRNEDGSASVTTENGDSYTIDPSGRAFIDLKTITAVGLQNLMDVEQHSIHRIVGSISHYVRFTGGGELRFSYNEAGQLIELSASQADVSITPQGELLFRPGKPPA